MGKAKLTSTNAEIIKKISSDRKTQAGRTRADFAGTSTSTVGVGAARAGSSTPNIQSFASSGGRISGAISLFPKTITIASGVIDLGDQTAGTGNRTSSTSNVNVIGEGDANDILVTINNDSAAGFDTGHVLFLKASGSQITLQHGTGSNGLFCPGSADYIIEASEGVSLIYGGTGAYWTVLGGSEGGSGGSGGDDLGDHVATQALKMNDSAIFFDTGLIHSIISGTNVMSYVVDDSSGGAHQFFVDNLTTPKLKITETAVEQTAISTNATYSLFNDNPTPNDFDTLGSIFFEGNDTVGTKTIMAKIDGLMNDTTNGSEDGEIIVSVRGAGFVAASELILNHTKLELHRQFSNTLGNGCEMLFHNDDPSMNDGQIVGQVTFDSNDSANNQTTYGQIIITAEDVTNGTEDGKIVINVMKEGTKTSIVEVTPTSFEPGSDNTFNLGSSSAEWKNLYVDGTAYIDTLEVHGSVFIDSLIEINGALKHDGSTVGFYGTTPTTRLLVTTMSGGETLVQTISKINSIIASLGTAGIGIFRH